MGRYLENMLGFSDALVGPCVTLVGHIPAPMASANTFKGNSTASVRTRKQSMVSQVTGSIRLPELNGDGFGFGGFGFCSETIHDGIDFVEQLGSLQANAPTPKIFSVLPQDFNSIELWAVGWQVIQVQVSVGPLLAFAFHNLAFVNGGVVNHHNARNRVRLFAQAVEESDHVIANSRPLLGNPGVSVFLCAGPRRLFHGVARCPLRVAFRRERV
ncbi:MAG: hypothetical protein JWM42_470 [Burkholderia sp.]|nr:hypothetical protein [Burkholderia sp.]